MTQAPPYQPKNSASFQLPQTFQSSPQQPISQEETHGGGAAFFSYIHILLKRKWILGGSLLFTLLIAFYLNITQKPVYKTSTQLVLEAKTSATSSNQRAEEKTPFDDATFLYTQRTLLKSPGIGESVVSQLENQLDPKMFLANFGLKPFGKREADARLSNEERANLARAVGKSLLASQVGGARIISIASSGYVPQIVRKVADAAGQAYIEINYQSSLEAFRQNFTMISKSLTEILEKTKTGEIAIQKINAEIELLNALKIYGEKHPDILRLQTGIPDLAKQLEAQLQNLKGMQIGQREELIPILLTAHTDFESLSPIERDLALLKPTLEQELATTREMYNTIYKRFQEVELSGTTNSWFDIKVLESAPMPGRPIKPDKMMNIILAIVLGFFVGVSLVFFLEYLDSSLRSPEDIRHYLRLFPLGMVPFVEVPGGQDAAKNADKKGHARPYWLASDSQVPLYVAEAYRIIRTNLSFGSLEHPIHIIQVTSAVKGEGKTTTAANLGISFVQSGMKVLLVDADLRRPSLHNIFGLAGITAGLSDVLSNEMDWRNAVMPSSVLNLDCLPAGPIPANPSELLSSKRMAEVLHDLSKNYDMIIIDSPPTISVADAAIIASRVDGTILVSRAGFIPRHLTIQAKQALEVVNGKIIGCVLNSIHSSNQPYYYYRYYNYADYYAQDDKKSLGNKEKLSWFDRLNALREPFWAFVSGHISRWIRLLNSQWKQSDDDTKPSSPGL